MGVTQVSPYPTIQYRKDAVICLQRISKIKSTCWQVCRGIRHQASQIRKKMELFVVHVRNNGGVKQALTPTEVLTNVYVSPRAGIGVRTHIYGHIHRWSTVFYVSLITGSFYACFQLPPIQHTLSIPYPILSHTKATILQVFRKVYNASLCESNKKSGFPKKGKGKHNKRFFCCNVMQCLIQWYTIAS